MQPKTHSRSNASRFEALLLCHAYRGFTPLLPEHELTGAHKLAISYGMCVSYTVVDAQDLRRKLMCSGCATPRIFKSMSIEVSHISPSEHGLKGFHELVISYAMSMLILSIFAVQYAM